MRFYWKNEEVSLKTVISKFLILYVRTFSCMCAVWIIIRCLEGCVMETQEGAFGGLQCEGIGFVLEIQGVERTGQSKWWD